MWEYNYYPNSDELYHHGIMGMKWGKRNGPPYPLGVSDHSSSEKKAGWRKSLDSDGRVAAAKKAKKDAKKNVKKTAAKARHETNKYQSHLSKNVSPSKKVRKSAEKQRQKAFDSRVDAAVARNDYKKAKKEYRDVKKEARNDRSIRETVNNKVVGNKIMDGKGTSTDYKKARGKVVAGALLATAAVGGATYVALATHNKKSISRGAAATRIMMNELSRNNMTVVNGTIISKKPKLVGNDFVTFKPDTFSYDTFKYATFKPD